MNTNWIRDWVIYRYYYWHNQMMPEPRTPITMQEIADIAGLTKGRVSQIIDSIDSGRGSPEFTTAHLAVLATRMVEMPGEKTLTLDKILKVFDAECVEEGPPST